MTIEHLGATRIAGHDVCSKILLVGESNPYGSDPRYALYHEPPNAAGHRLQRRILGVDAREWYLPMWRTNLCTGDFSIDDATHRARELIAADAPWNVVVMLGRKVATAFALPGSNFALRPFGNAVSVGFAKVFLTISLPHPSGRNSAIWTRPAILRARALLAELAPGIPWGHAEDTAKGSP
jgi:hypothetical protein